MSKIYKQAEKYRCRGGGAGSGNGSECERVGLSEPVAGSSARLIWFHERFL